MNSNSRIILGVCKRLSEETSISVEIIRYAFIFLTIFSGGGIAIYLICALAFGPGTMDTD